MRLILLGPPGSGKGTQAKLLSTRHGLEHIATGDLLREAMENNTPAGSRARPFMGSGNLVPDDLVNEMVAERFDAPDSPQRFVMDGYPRTVAQAETFARLLQRHERPLIGVVLLTVADEEIVRRISGRRVCPNPACKAIYHVEDKPARQAGVCDECGTNLVQREDDKEATVRERLAVYHQRTEGLIPYYRQRGLLREVCGTGDIEEIYAKIMQALQTQAGSSC